MRDLPKRKNIRLEGYDYSLCGAYFITICTHNRECLLAEIVGQGLCPCRISSIGKIIGNEIENISKRFKNILISKYVIMPNHVHLILVITPQQGQSPCPTIGDIIGAMKSISTKMANSQDAVFGRKIWQFRFHDHIIRNEREYQEIWKYIDENPLKWEDDSLYCK